MAVFRENHYFVDQMTPRTSTIELSFLSFPFLMANFNNFEGVFNRIYLFEGSFVRAAFDDFYFCRFIS